MDGRHSNRCRGLHAVYDLRESGCNDLRADRTLLTGRGTYAKLCLKKLQPALTDFFVIMTGEELDAGRPDDDVLLCNCWSDFMSLKREVEKYIYIIYRWKEWKRECLSLYRCNTDRRQLQSLQDFMAFQINHMLSTFLYIYIYISLVSWCQFFRCISVLPTIIFTFSYLGAVTWLQ